MAYCKTVKPVFMVLSVSSSLLIGMMLLLAACVQIQPMKSAATVEAMGTATVVITDVAITEESISNTPITKCLETSGNGEYQYSYFVYTPTDTSKVTFYNIDGKAVIQGDIVLGSFEEAKIHPDDLPGVLSSSVINSDKRWPGAEIPYVISGGLLDVARVSDAISFWEQNTRIKFVERTDEKNYVYFVQGGGCSSSVGMIGGRQEIILEPGCTKGNVMHEIGHTVGLWHEQSRQDRDSYVIINTNNIVPDAQENFDHFFIQSNDLGPYDFDSIMHYADWAFSRECLCNAQGRECLPTIEAKGGQKMGQRDHLSNGDIDAVVKLYPPPTVNGFKSPPKAVSWGENRLDVFGVGGEHNEIYHLTWDGTQWGSREGPDQWESLGGKFASDSLSVVSWGEKRLDIFAVSTLDRKVHHLTWNDTRWLWDGQYGQWNSRGGKLSSPSGSLSSPNAVSWGKNQLDIFAVFEDKKMHHLTWDGKKWGNWESLDGEFKSSPTAVSWGKNRLDIFGVGNDNKMYHRAWNGSQWSSGVGKANWEAIGNDSVMFDLSPSAVSWGKNRLDIFGWQSSNTTLFYIGWDGAQWINSAGTHDWEAVDDRTNSAPCVVSRGKNLLDVFAINNDQKMLHISWDGSKWSTEVLGDNKFAFKSPSAVSWGKDRLDVFGLGSDHQEMLHMSWDGSKWFSGKGENKWEPLGTGDKQP